MQTSNEDRTKRFRSALGIDDLTATIFQYAMCAGEARSKLLSDPGLMPLYNKYNSTYVE